MAFYLPPSEPFLTNLCVEALLADWPLAPDAPDVAAGLHLLRTTLCEENAVQALLPALREEYTVLFIGLERVAAPPWESVYLSRDHLLFDEQTLQVRDAYAAFGLQIPHIDREPDDHIGFELLFLAHLMQQAAHAGQRRPQRSRALSGRRAQLSSRPPAAMGQALCRTDRAPRAHRLLPGHGAAANGRPDSPGNDDAARSSGRSNHPSVAA
ncbi:MAG: molecular chaperone TorD family protein [Anaerolineales bacterium]|nr:molecular chaperone TorD family protein [Anaerolineales bacterium]